MNSFRCSTSTPISREFYVCLLAAPVALRRCGNIIIVRRTSTDTCSIFHLCLCGRSERLTDFVVCLIWDFSSSDESVWRNGAFIGIINSVSIERFHNFCGFYLVFTLRVMHRAQCTGLLCDCFINQDCFVSIEVSRNGHLWSFGCDIPSPRENL